MLVLFYFPYEDVDNKLGKVDIVKRKGVFYAFYC